MLNRTPLTRPAGALSFALLTIFLCSGFAAPQGCDNSGDGFGKDIAIGAGAVGAAVIGTVVLVHENNVHHNVTGCVYQTPDGLEIRTSDNKSFKLAGDTSALKEGDTLSLHGDRLKKDKHAPGDQVFQVSKVKKDKGPCKVMPASANP